MVHPSTSEWVTRTSLAVCPYRSDPGRLICLAENEQLIPGIAHLIPVNPHPRPPSEDIIAANTAERISRIKRLDRLAREHAERQAQLGEKAFEKGGEKARAKREARARARAKAEKAQAKAGGAAGGEDVGERKGGGAGAGAGQEDSVEDPGATPQGRMAGMEDVDRSSEPPFSEDGQSVATPERETTLDTGSNGQPTQDLASTTTSTSAPTTPLISKSDTSKPTPSPTFISSHFHAIPSHPLPRTNPFLPSITALPHPLFPFPTTPRHLALLSVFTTLQTRGYRVGLGPRFGGEYLIYPGDYLRYHAHFTSQVIVRDECIKPTEIVAWGRLGTGTKKAGLLCCWDDGERGEGGPQQVSTSEGEKRDMPDGAGPGEKKGEVEFYSLEWANFG